MVHRLMLLCVALLLLGRSACRICRQQSRPTTACFVSGNRRAPPVQQQHEMPGSPSRFSRSLAAADDGVETDGSLIYATDLSKEQLAVARRAIESRENLFITGAAGTGKSFLLRYIIQELQQRHNKTSSVAVTAPTGIAAVNIGGSTIHSFAGIGLAKGDAVDIVDRVSKNRRAKRNWKRARVLVIDEVSMLSSDLFELLDFIAKEIRHPSWASFPFGKLQLIFCGDFCQLPPVRGSFAFQSSLWQEAGLDGDGTVVLKKVHRQVDDPKFVRMLNELRWGALTDTTHYALDFCHINNKPVPDDGIVPTKLYCCNIDVDRENEERLAELQSPLVEVEAVDTFSNVTVSSLEKTLRDLMDKRVARTLRLKKGAQVVLLRNRPGDSLLKNGSRGVITGFDSDNNPSVRFDCGITETVRMVEFLQGNAEEGYLVRKQLPLKLAWALTVHRAQGMTLSRVELMLDGAFAPGQAYVALSRATSLSGLYMNTRLQQRDVRAHPEVISFYRKAANREQQT